MKKLLIKLFAKKVGKALKLEEGTPMENCKPWYKSKAVLNGIVIVLISGYEAIRLSLAPALGHSLPEIPPMLYTILGALGIYSRVTADKKIGS